MDLSSSQNHVINPYPNNNLCWTVKPRASRTTENSCRENHQCKLINCHSKIRPLNLSMQDDHYDLSKLLKHFHCSQSFLTVYNDELIRSASISSGSSLYRSIESAPIQSSTSILPKSSPNLRYSGPPAEKLTTIKPWCNFSDRPYPQFFLATDVSAKQPIGRCCKISTWAALSELTNCQSAPSIPSSSKMSKNLFHVAPVIYKRINRDPISFTFPWCSHSAFSMSDKLHKAAHQRNNSHDKRSGKTRSHWSTCQLWPRMKLKCLILASNCASTSRSVFFVLKMPCSYTGTNWQSDFLTFSDLFFSPSTWFLTHVLVFPTPIQTALMFSDNPTARSRLPATRGLNTWKCPLVLFRELYSKPVRRAISHFSSTKDL